MLYNKEKKKIKGTGDCFSCSMWENRTKTCRGLNKVCFEYDPKTQTIIDGNTKLPRKI